VLAGSGKRSASLCASSSGIVRIRMP
jgi:hypothetical protein